LADRSLAAADITAACQQNLLKHISQVQDGIDERLAVIEKQVTGMSLSFLKVGPLEYFTN